MLNSISPSRPGFASPLLPSGSYEPIAHSGGCQSMDIHFYELFITFCLPLKLDQNRLVQPVLVSAERSGIKPETNESRRDSVATRRGDSVLPRKISDTRSPIVKLPAESDVLAG